MSEIKRKREEKKKTYTQHLEENTILIFDKERGTRLRYARNYLSKRNIVTLAELAKDLGISTAMLSRIEMGDIKAPGVLVSTWKKILGRHFSYVLFGKDYEEYERFRYVGIDQFGNPFATPYKRGDGEFTQSDITMSQKLSKIKDEENQ